MPISIKIAETAGEVDAALRLRHQVYADEEKRFAPSPDQRIFDRFDGYPSTRLVLARDLSHPERPVVGTLRYALESDAGLPSDVFYDFSETRKGLDGGVATVGMLAVARRFRLRRGLVAGLIKVAAREIRLSGARHVVAPVSPDIEPVLRALGGVQVGEAFHHGDPPVFMTPLHVDMDALPPFFRETACDPHYLMVDRVMERRLFRHGETILREGDPGDEAYLVMRGSVRVYAEARRERELIGLLGPGQVLGELALLDGGPRTATVVAHSRVLDLAVIPKKEFQARVSSDHDFCRRMLSVLGERQRRTALRLPPDSVFEHDQEALTAGLLIEVSEGATQPVDANWLAAECGLALPALEQMLAAWEAAATIRRRPDALIEVADATGLLAAAHREHPAPARPPGIGPLPERAAPEPLERPRSPRRGTTSNPADGNRVAVSA